MTSSLSSADIILQNSNLYKEFLKERDEILRHKWFMSEYVELLLIKTGCIHAVVV